MMGVKRPKHVEKQLITNKSLLLHLVGLAFIYYTDIILPDDNMKMSKHVAV
jgi:hypothetical protein